MKNLKLLLILFSANMSAQEYNPHKLNFNGYIRTGMGRSQNGGEMVDFQAPSVTHKFRLGNEANHLGELQFGYKYQPENEDKSFEIQYMMARYQPYGDNSRIVPETAQLYARMNNLFGTADIWLGKRYYDRRNVELWDYFWVNSGQNAQMGVGIEDISLPKNTRLDLALFQFRYDTPELHNPLNINTKNRYSYTFDARYLNYPLSENNKLNGIAQLGVIQGVTEQKLPTNFAWSLGGWWHFSKGNIRHNSIVLYRNGQLMNPTPYTGEAVSDYVFRGGNWQKIYDFGKSYSFDFINDFVYDDKQNHAIQGTLVYRNKSYGIGNVDVDNQPINQNKIINSLSVGFRYLYYIHKHFNLAVELGTDYSSDQKTGVSGSLNKITFAPQISWDYGYFSRPVLRPFVTFASWSDSFKGLTGVSPYNTYFSDKTSAITYGIQLEVWW